MYSYEDRINAVTFDIKLGKLAGTTFLLYLRDLHQNSGIQRALVLGMQNS